MAGQSNPINSGIKQVARLTARSAARKQVTAHVGNPLLAAVAIAVVNFFIKKIR